MNWREEPVGRSHDRQGFDCGSPELNEYLRRYARQNHESGGAKTFVAVSPSEPKRVLGYYSLAPTHVESARVPPQITRGLGRYDIPGVRLARLAVDRSVQGQGIGAALLYAAGRRALTATALIGGRVLVIDAKDEQAARWYERFGAVRLLDDPLILVLPFAQIASASEEPLDR